MLPIDDSPETNARVAQMMEEENLQAKKRHLEILKDPEYVKRMKQKAKEQPKNPFLSEFRENDIPF